MANDDFVDIIKFVPILISCAIIHLIKNIFRILEEPHGIYSNNLPRLISRTNGSNLGPPGIARFKALAVKKDFKSKR